MIEMEAQWSESRQNSMKRTIIPSTYISYNPSIVLPTNCKICFEAELPEKHPSLGNRAMEKVILDRNS